MGARCTLAWPIIIRCLPPSIFFQASQPATKPALSLPPSLQLSLEVSHAAITTDYTTGPGIRQAMTTGAMTTLQDQASGRP